MNVCPDYPTIVYRLSPDVLEDRTEYSKTYIFLRGWIDSTRP